MTQGDEGNKEKTNRKKLGSNGLDSLMGKRNTEGEQDAYYTELNREAGSLHTAEQGGVVITYS